MLYKALKILARTSIRIFCRKLVINQPDLLKIKGPVLLAANHPNSFLDSIILDSLFQQPVWSLARGDVFKKSFYIRLLTLLKILPVYRTSEGVENLSENYRTFEACIGIFREKGIVTIFSEGKCINEWHLRPLKKGTARLAVKAWEEGIPLKVLPVGINYSSFTRFGKNIFLHFGKIIQSSDISLKDADGPRHQSFNAILEKELKQLVFEIPKNDREKQKEILALKISAAKRVVLSIPALTGWILHAPLYLPVKAFVKKRTRNTDHFDSVLMAILLVTYPFYLILITVAIAIIACWWSLLVFVLLPFTAWSFVQLKGQLDK